MAVSHKEEQEELEYYYNTHPEESAQDRRDAYNRGYYRALTEPNEREEMEYYYQQHPTPRERVDSAIDRVRGAANRVIGYGANLERSMERIESRREDIEQRNRKARDSRTPQPGPVRSGLARSMQDPLIRQIAGGSGFGGLGSGPMRSRAQPQPPSRAGTIVITTCDDYGNCKTKKISGGAQKPRTQRRRGYPGSLGGDDPGFL